MYIYIYNKYRATHPPLTPSSLKYIKTTFNPPLFLLHNTLFSLLSREALL